MLNQKRKFLVGISTSVLWPKVKLTYLINIPIVRGLCVLPVYIFADGPVLVERYSNLVILMVASNIISLPIQVRVYSPIPNVGEWSIPFNPHIRIYIYNLYLYILYLKPRSGTFCWWFSQFSPYFIHVADGFPIFVQPSARSGCHETWQLLNQNPQKFSAAQTSAVAGDIRWLDKKNQPLEAGDLIYA